MSDRSADMVTAANGTTYAAWIAGTPSRSARKIYLCVLPLGATACKGGVQSTASLGDSSAEGLRLLIVNGTVTLIWQHTTSVSLNGRNGDQLAKATVSPAGVLQAADDVATAPSFGSLLDAEVSPSGEVWTLSYAGLPEKSLQVREGIANPPVTVTTPYDLSYAHVAWDHGTTIIGIEKGGSDIGQPVAYSASAVGSFTSFHNLAHTWSVATDFDLINAGGHVRVITGINNASYLPVVASWNGTGFTSRTLTGYLSGGPSPTSHDPSTDRSGRLVDVSEAAGPKVVVSNLVDDRHAALFSFPAGGTLAGTVPQVATTARGRGWVMWGVEDGSVGTKLRIVPIRLAGLHKTVTKHGLHGSVTLTGPASCLPASAISIKARGHAKSGWKAHAAKLLLGTKGVASPLNGAALTAAKSYTLKGVVVFSNKKHPHRHSKVTAALPFRTCPNP